ncbi:hypothetical protein BDB01DRAFT_786808 [Pilobolus umbonatus]|nr:hypothetical protein BDB01DRAFT_786808 [Pilobolus umbonatus]
MCKQSFPHIISSSPYNLSNMSVDVEKTTDLKEVANILSNAYHSILQHTTLPEQSTIEHLDQLIKYADYLPFSWFTMHFIDTILALKDTFEQSKQLEALDATTVLLEGWIRRLSSDTATLDTPTEKRLSVVMDFFLRILSSLNNEYLSIQKNAWKGWVSFVGITRKVIYPDTILLKGMTDTIVLYVRTNDELRNNYLGEMIDAGVAHALSRTNALNDFEVDVCQELLEAEIQFSSIRHEGYRGIMTAMEHVMDIRSKQSPQSKVDADISSLVKMVTHIMDQPVEPVGVHLARLASLAGVLRMLQYHKGKSTKKILEFKGRAEEVFVKQLDIVLETITLDLHVNELRKNQDILSLLASACILQVSDALIKGMENTSILLKTLTSCLLTSPYTFNNGDILHRLENTPEMVAEVHQLTQNPLFKDIGRICRTIGKVIEVLLDSKKSILPVQSIVDRLLGISYNTYFDWDEFIMKYSSMSMTPEENVNYKKLEGEAWTVLKSMAFGFTVILKSIAVDVSDGQGLIQLPHAVQDILSIYANLNFIVEHFGEGAARQAYQDILTNSVAFLLLEDNHCQLNKFLSTAFKEYASSNFVYDRVDSVELLSMIKQSRLTFFLDLVEQVMKDIDDSVFEKDILPVIYPVLKWRRIENKNLYESAHTVIISAFTAEKEVCMELAGVYAQILINNYPDSMNLEQFRYGFTTLIQSLCEMNDALAWLTVNLLIVKIHSLQSDKELTRRNEYITALIDLLKPLSLGPFFPSILDEIKTLIVNEQSRTIQTAIMKILFETVSGTGISDMRRVEAVGWFLELKHQLKL